MLAMQIALKTKNAHTMWMLFEWCARTVPMSRKVCYLLPVITAYIVALAGSPESLCKTGVPYWSCDPIMPLATAFPLISSPKQLGKHRVFHLLEQTIGTDWVFSRPRRTDTTEKPVVRSRLSQWLLDLHIIQWQTIHGRQPWRVVS